jgi:hypothetical protein
MRENYNSSWISFHFESHTTWCLRFLHLVVMLLGENTKRTRDIEKVFSLFNAISFYLRAQRCDPHFHYSMKSDKRIHWPHPFVSRRESRCAFLLSLLFNVSLIRMNIVLKTKCHVNRKNGTLVAGFIRSHFGRSKYQL